MNFSNYIPLMAAMLGVASGRGSRLKMIIIWIHSTSRLRRTVFEGQIRSEGGHVDSESAV